MSLINLICNFISLLTKQKAQPEDYLYLVQAGSLAHIHMTFTSLFLNNITRHDLVNVHGTK